jgi:hypothetical protein
LLRFLSFFHIFSSRIIFLSNSIKNPVRRLDIVTHIYNPSSVGGRDRKDHGSRTARAKSQ